MRGLVCFEYQYHWIRNTNDYVYIYLDFGLFLLFSWNTCVCSSILNAGAELEAARPRRRRRAGRRGEKLVEIQRRTRAAQQAEGGICGRAVTSGGAPSYMHVHIHVYGHTMAMAPSAAAGPFGAWCRCFLTRGRPLVWCF